jgi:hypothetical protein
MKYQSDVKKLAASHNRVTIEPPLVHYDPGGCCW